MAIAIRASTHLDNNSSQVSSWVANKPSGTLQNELMIALWCINDSDAFTFTPAQPGGWTQIGSISQSQSNRAGAVIYAKVAGASEPSTYTFTSTQTHYGDLFIYTLNGFASTPTTSLIKDNDTQTQASITSHAYKTLAAGATGRIALWGQTGFNSNGTVTSSRGGTTKNFDATYGCSFSETGIGTGTVAHTITTSATEAGLAAVIVEDASAATIDQEGARFRNDNGSETTATWKAAQDTDITGQAKLENFRLRFLLNATGDPPSQIYKIQYRKVGDGSSEWRDIPLS